MKEMVKDRVCTNGDVFEALILTHIKGYYISQEELDMTLEQFRAKVCNTMGEPQRKLMCFQATPTAEQLDKFPTWVHFGLNFAMKPVLVSKQ